MLAGCRDEDNAASREYGTVDMKLGAKSYRLWVANHEVTRQRGLMHRQTLDADRGMIFVFPKEEPLSFYMKDTFIPLDIIYANAAGKVVSIKRMKPMDRDASGQWVTTPSDGPAKYAIELNAGAADEAGVKVGDQLQIPAEAANTNR